MVSPAQRVAPATAFSIFGNMPSLVLAAVSGGRVSPGKRLSARGEGDLALELLDVCGGSVPLPFPQPWPSLIHRSTRAISASCPTSPITTAPARRSPGRRRAAASTACRRGGSTSPTRRSIATPRGGARTTSRSAGSARAAPSRLHLRAPARASDRFANALRGLGVGTGERVFVLAGRIPELYIAALGTLKNRSVFCPLFSAFGPEPIQARMSIGDAAVLVTTERTLRAQGRRRCATRCRSCATCFSPAARRNERPCRRRMTSGPCSPRSEGRVFAIPPTDPEDMALLHFTSGTTGKPKGAMHVHEAVVAHHVTGTLRARSPRRTTSSGARPIRAGSPAPPTASSRRSPTASPASSTRPSSTPSAGTRILAGPAGHRLVHGADGDPHADEGRRRGGARVRSAPACASSPASASR